MKIKHYLYNAFIIEEGQVKIAIDPGAKFLHFFRLTTLIPKSEWKEITHIFVTHGDIDHYWHTDRVARLANAPLICNKTMVKDVNGKKLLLGPRDKGIAFTTPIKRLYTVAVDETIQLDGMSVTGIKVTHGALTFKFGPFSKTLMPDPHERIGWGAMGFEIRLEGKTLINLGDTLLHENEWRRIKNPDILMIPIGGKKVHNTMDEAEALRAVSIMRPELVIPCHYNCPAFFSRKFNPADDKKFKEEVRKMGIECSLMKYGDEILV
jgi:L-ascorbate metabolism protein UlaG (beta-lactamase superfamily)